MRRILGFVVIAALVGAAGWYGYSKVFGCSGCGALDTHRSQWRSLHLTDYSYVYEKGGMACCYRVRITVRGGRVVNAEVLQHVFTDKNPTVDEVFAAARREMHVADHVHVEYDARYGFPRSVDVDPNDHTMDDEFGFRIEQFRSLTAGRA
jgi:hypothetical protein